MLKNRQGEFLNQFQFSDGFRKLFEKVQHVFLGNFLEKYQNIIWDKLLWRIPNSLGMPVEGNAQVCSYWNSWSNPWKNPV